jgi:hypothetical protein
MRLASHAVSLKGVTLPGIKRMENKTPGKVISPFTTKTRANIRRLTVTRRPGFPVPGMRLTGKHKTLKKRGE